MVAEAVEGGSESEQSGSQKWSSASDMDWKDPRRCEYRVPARCSASSRPEALGL